MSNKFKKLVRSVSEKSGVSHAGAVNLLRKGQLSVPALRPLDPVLIKAKAVPLAGEHTHEAGLVSAVLEDGTVVVTPAAPRNTLGGVSFYGHEKPARYRAEDVRPYRLKKGELFARFVESVFDEVPYDPAVPCDDGSIPWLFRKPDEIDSFIVGEEGESILLVSRGLVHVGSDGSLSDTLRPRRVAIPLWRCASDIVEDGVVVGQDAVKMMRAVRDRMVAMMACAALSEDPLDLLVESTPPDSIPNGCTWVVQDIDDTLSRDLGLIVEPEKVRKCSFLRGRYACGSGKVGRYVVSPGSRGILLLRSDVTVVHLRGDRT